MKIKVVIAKGVSCTFASVLKRGKTSESALRKKENEKRKSESGDKDGRLGADHGLHHLSLSLDVILRSREGGNHGVVETWKPGMC